MLTVKDLDVRDKKVFLRVDFNVPLDEKRNIRDDTRIRAALPTLTHLLEKDAAVVVASHFGRPKGTYKPEFSMEPVAAALSELISRDVVLAPGVVGDEVEKLKKELGRGSVLLLENLRFHPGEKANDPGFARLLAQGMDAYVNDAFGACHRAHASIVGIPRLVETSAAGFLVSKEVEYLDRVVRSPQKPFVAVLGGAKVSDKIPVIESLLEKADAILIGGAMAYTFFASRGMDVGRSLVEKEMVELAGALLDRAASMGVQVQLPLDHVAVPDMTSEAGLRIIQEFPIPADLMAVDIGPLTREKYGRVIASAQTIFWNGPMGVFEVDAFAEGTVALAEAVAESGAVSIVGGGDSAAAVVKAGVQDRISHISTGGGASLEYVAKGTLPGIQALMEK